MATPTFLYKIAGEINANDWLEFVRTKLELDEPRINNIEENHKYNASEKKFQMLELWTKQNPGTRQDQEKWLRELKDDFLHVKDNNQGSSQAPHQHRQSTESLSDHAEASSQLPEGAVKLTGIYSFYPNRKLSPYGRVYEGIRNSEVLKERDIAVKIVEFDKKNKNEANFLEELNPHKHIVQIFHSDVFHRGPEKLIYIAMEKCLNRNLNDYITKLKECNTPLDTEKSLEFSRQLLLGIIHIHEHDIIHRDLKPHNILFSVDGNIKITDYGLSKKMTSGRSVTALTARRIGTDGYRAPETYLCDEISKQADIFSLGLTFFFIWSNGHHPFGKDKDSWNLNIKYSRDRDFSELCIQPKTQVEDLLSWMLRFRPKERPTAEQILKHTIFGGDLKNPHETDLYRGIVEVDNTMRYFEEYKLSKYEEIFAGELTIPSETGKHSANTRAVAVKIMDNKQLFLSEVQSVRNVENHQNIVKILNAGSFGAGNNRKIHVTMEMCFDRNLYDVIASRQQTFEHKQALGISQQVIAGIVHLHNCGIIHKDMKPHSVYFDQNRTVKIANYGLSKGLDTDNAPIVGTDGYKAPELLSGGTVVTKMSDIYSLGLTLFFIWSCGGHPFGDDHNDWNYNIKKNLDRNLHKRLFIPNSKMPHDLLKWMLRYCPQDRPTAEQIVGHKVFGGTEENPHWTDDYPGLAGGRIGLKREVLDKVGANLWPQFARLKLNLPCADIDNIQVNHRNDIEEQKYQMLLLWEKKSQENNDEKLRRLTDQFLMRFMNRDLKVEDQTANQN